MTHKTFSFYWSHSQREQFMKGGVQLELDAAAGPDSSETQPYESVSAGWVWLAFGLEYEPAFHKLEWEWDQWNENVFYMLHIIEGKYYGKYMGLIYEALLCGCMLLAPLLLVFCPLFLLNYFLLLFTVFAPCSFWYFILLLHFFSWSMLPIRVFMLLALGLSFVCSMISYSHTLTT